MSDSDDAIIHKKLASIIGHPVWGIRQVHGSITDLEFGKPHLRIREPREPDASLSPSIQKRFRQRLIYPAGEWRLQLYMCAWKVMLDSAVLAHSESPKPDFERVADQDMLGRKLEGVKIELAGAHTEFGFEGGLKIVSWPLEAQHEQWNVKDESESLVALRGDGAFSLYDSKTVLNDRVWAKVEGASIITVGNVS